MENSTVGIAAVIIIVIIAAILWWVFASAKKVDLTSTPEGQKPEWMQSTPPKETPSGTLYKQTDGEKLAAPFAEQIEDIIQAEMAAYPSLSHYKVDFGTAKDGGLEIYVDDDMYSSIKEIPDERLRALIERCIATYNKRS